MMEERETRGSALDEFAKSISSPPTQAMNVLPLATASFDIITAQEIKKPRDLSLVLSHIRALAAAGGSDWFYRIPFRDKKKGTITYAEGLSIKGANEVAREFGNCFVDTRFQDLGDYWAIYAKFTDLESGYSLVRPFMQRKSASRIGGEDESRRTEQAFAIGVSKSIRNCITNGLQSLADFALEEARGALVDRIGKRLEHYREQTIERLASHIDVARAEAVIGRPRQEWTAPDVAKIIAMAKAVSDGMSTWNETFPPAGAADDNDEVSGSAETTTQTLETFAGGPGSADGSDAAPILEDAGAATSASENDPPSLAEDFFDTISRRMQNAPTVEAVHEIWEQLEVDAYFEDDKKGRDKAWKIASKRLDQLGKAS